MADSSRKDSGSVDRYNNAAPINALRTVQPTKRTLLLVQPKAAPTEAVNFGNVVNQLRVVPTTTIEVSALIGYGFSERKEASIAL